MGVLSAIGLHGGRRGSSTPAEPEEEGADELERGGVALELLGVLPAAEARAKDLGAHLGLGLGLGSKDLGAHLGLGLGLGSKELGAHLVGGRAGGDE